MGSETRQSCRLCTRKSSRIRGGCHHHRHLGSVGPFFHYSDSWQLVINTATTIVTFLMVFLIQATQNRDAQALQLKLDELIRCTRDARNTLAKVELATEAEVQELQEEFKELRANELG